MRSVRPVAVRFKCCLCGMECPGGPVQVARGKRNFGLGDHTSRTRDSFLLSEGSSRTPHERLRANEVAKLSHCDAAQRKGRRIAAQRNAIQCAKRITCRECSRRRRD